MASQVPRPAWFRLSSIANRPAAPNPAPAPAPAPTPAPAPIRPTAPIPTALRPTIPIGLPSAIAQTQEPPSPPPVGSSAPVAPLPSPPKSPILTPAAPLPSPSKSPISIPAPSSVSAESPLVPSGPPASPLRSPSPTAGVPPPHLADPAKSPVMRPTPPPSPRTLASPISSPPPSTIGLKPTSPVQLKPSETSAYGPASSSPKTKNKSPSSSEKTSPVPRPGASTAAPGATANHKVTAPVSSPKRSPGIKPFSNPPSPFTLPPVQKTEDEDEQKIPAEVDQKTVLVQETIEKPIKKTSALSNGIDSARREHVMKDRSTNRKKSDSDEFGMSVITLAGENKGAIMELSPSQKKNYSNGNPQSFLKNKNKISGDQLSSDSGEEGKSNRNGKTNKAMKMQAQPMTVFLNSNVQGVNNSILCNCNYKYNDPGVHLSLDKKVNGSRHKDHHGQGKGN